MSKVLIAVVFAAEQLRIELIKILEGESPYDIFVRWKPLHEQPIGWEPDINDGIRVNIRPFATARSSDQHGRRRTNSGILRAMPKITWDTDRGKEPERERAGFPWFWSWDGLVQDFRGGSIFDGVRWTNFHCSLVFKQASRARQVHENDAYGRMRKN